MGEREDHEGEQECVCVGAAQPERDWVCRNLKGLWRRRLLIGWY